jgi:ATP-dependent DNA helicase RecG
MSIPINIQDLLSGKIVEGTRMEFKQGWNQTAIMRLRCRLRYFNQNQ